MLRDQEQRSRAKKAPSRRLRLFQVLVLVLLILGAGGVMLAWREIDADPTVVVPERALPSPNGYEGLLRASAALVMAQQIDGAVQCYRTDRKRFLHWYTTTEKAALLKANAPALRELRRALPLPYCAPRRSALRERWPDAPQSLILSRLLGIEGQIRLTRHEWAGALRTSLDGLELGIKVVRGTAEEHEGAQIEWLHRRQAWEALPHVNAGSAKAAARRLEGLLPLHVPYADTLEEQKWSGALQLAEAFRRQGWRYDRGAGPWTAAPAPANPGSSMEGWGRFIAVNTTSKRRIMANYLQYWDQVIAAAKMPYSAASLTQVIAVPAGPIRGRTGGPPRTALVTRVIPLPNDPVNQRGTAWDFARRLLSLKQEAADALLLTALALQAYREEHGVYPASLGALVPGYLEKVRGDPFQPGSPLRYHLRAGEYSLYCVGMDGVDNGGKARRPTPSMDTWGSAGVMQGEDMVAGVND
jgi:hypothetical protein